MNSSAMPDEKRYAALPFEAVKVSLRQNKDGVLITFVVHPSDVHPQLLTDQVGTRYQLVAVRLGDNGEPVPSGRPMQEPVPEARKQGKEASSPPGEGQGMSPMDRTRANVVASAGILCRDPRFWEWVTLQAKYPFKVEEVEAASWLVTQCGVVTRAALKTNTEARAKFFALREAFEEWKDSTPPF